MVDMRWRDDYLLWIVFDHGIFSMFLFETRKTGLIVVHIELRRMISRFLASDRYISLAIFPVTSEKRLLTGKAIKDDPYFSFSNYVQAHRLVRIRWIASTCL